MRKLYFQRDSLFLNTTPHTVKNLSQTILDKYQNSRPVRFQQFSFITQDQVKRSLILQDITKPTV